MANSKTGVNDSTASKSVDPLEEMNQIFQEASRQTGVPIEMFPEEGLKLLPDLQDPSKSYSLYYQVIDKFKRKYIPAKQDGQPIRDEINKFLKEGEDRGADGRQAYTSKMHEAIQHCQDWLTAYEGEQLMKLYLKFKELNDEVAKQKAAVSESLKKTGE